MNFPLLREIYIFLSLHLKLLDHHHPELCIFLFVDGSEWFNITTKWVKLRQKMAFTFFPETCPWIFWFLDSNYRRWILKKVLNTAQKTIYAIWDFFSKFFYRFKHKFLYEKVATSKNILESFNPYQATDLFWFPLKTSENLWFSDVFRGYQKRSVT